MNTLAREELRKLVERLQAVLDETTYELVARSIVQVLDLRQRAWEGGQRVLRARLQDIEMQRQAIEQERRALRQEGESLAEERDRLRLECANWEARKEHLLEADLHALDLERQALEQERLALAREREALAAAWQEIDAARALALAWRPDEKEAAC